MQRRVHMRACRHMGELPSPPRCTMCTGSALGVVEAVHACSRARARVRAYSRNRVAGATMEGMRLHA